MGRGWEQVEIEVCTDCLIALANGLPDELEPDRAAAIVAGAAGWAEDGWELVPGGSDPPYFSAARCEVCDDTRAGDRSQAWALRRPEQPAGGRGRWTQPVPAAQPEAARGAPLAPRSACLR
jgi:hypothetical protein